MQKATRSQSMDDWANAPVARFEWGNREGLRKVIPRALQINGDPKAAAADLCNGTNDTNPSVKPRILHHPED